MAYGQYGQKDEVPADNKWKLGLIAVAVIVAVALAIWSGFRALDTRPRVTGVLGDGPPPRGAGAAQAATRAPSSEPVSARGQ